MSEGVPVVLLTGTVGSGTTTIARVMNDGIAERRVPNAAIDLDEVVLHRVGWI
jgi:adenylylsulfate kinase-like enzyme